MAENPYAAPTAEVADIAVDGDFALASRGARLAAAIVDAILVALPAIAVAMAVGLSTGSMTTNAKVSSLGSGATTTLVLAGLWLLALVVFDLIFLYANGQTIGKKVLNIKIVRKDGSRCSLARIVSLRFIANGLIGGSVNFVLGLATVRIYWIIDALFIFGSSRRCIHDYIADTIVIKA